MARLHKCSYLAGEHAKLREDVAKFRPRQKELKSKLAAEKAAEEKADNLKGQLALEKAKAQQAEAEKNSKLQWVEAKK